MVFVECAFNYRAPWTMYCFCWVDLACAGVYIAADGVGAMA